MIDLSLVRKISMLSDDVLERLQAEARFGHGGILEIGSYIGGSTVALASGHMGRRRHAVIEAGGAYPDQPFLPTDDIIRDWKSNIERFGVTGYARLFQGWSNDYAVLSAALAHTGPVGLFFFDANGAVATQFSLISRHLRHDCTIVLDDYNVTSGCKDKEIEVRGWVDRMTDVGALVQTDIVDSAWIGKLGRVSPDVFNIYWRDEGHAALSVAPDPNVSKVIVYEDGRPLGPCDSMHDHVRGVGKGAFSQWNTPTGPHILFSASDNTDPTTNGRRYEFREVHQEISNSIEPETVSPVAQVIG
jgi:hypothetical protein